MLKHLFSFRGRMGRAAYAQVALPILLILHFKGVISHYVLIHAGVNSLTTYPTAAIAVVLLLSLLAVPLTAVSARRLHDLRLPGRLAAPYLIALLANLYYAGLKSSSVVEAGRIIVSDHTRVVGFVSAGLYYYGLILALVLLLVPAKPDRIPLVARG